MEHRPKDRILGIRNEVLGKAAVEVAEGINPDLRNRIEEVIAAGGDPLLFLGKAIGASRQVIELARQNQRNIIAAQNGR